MSNLKNLSLISMMLLCRTVINAQPLREMRSIEFQHPGATAKIRIELGSKVIISVKHQPATISGFVQSIIDSTLVLRVREQPYRVAVPMKSIESVKLAWKSKPLRARVTLMSGEKVKGTLIRVTQDSITIGVARPLPRKLSATEIRTIQLHRKEWQGVYIGAGAFLGGVIGYATASINQDQNDFFASLSDFARGAEGAVIGALAGWAVSTFIAQEHGEYKIDGHPEQFSWFASEFMR